MWPNPVAGSDSAKFQQALAANFNTVSLENCGKWYFSEGTKGVVTLGYADAIYDFAKAHGMRARYHTLLWGDAQPQWVIDLENKALGSDAKAAAAAKVALSDAIKARAAYIAKDRGQKFIELDGINEASSGHQPVFLNIYDYPGIAEIYRNAIAQLRAGKSTARVYFNDYNILNYGPDSFSSWYLNFIRSVIDTGMTAPEQARLGVGIQYYHFGGGSHDPVRVFQSLANLGSLGLPISITEFGADNGRADEAKTILPDTLRLVFGNDQATTFNTWGFYAPWMWINGAAFFDANWNITQVGKIWQQVTGIKNWNLPGVPSYETDVTLKTDAAGKVSLRGFLGDYEIVSGLLKGAVSVKSGVVDYAVKVKR
jgi:endo-1,4-beta-xylanase